MENHHRNSGFSHEKMWFSIVMLVYQRVFSIYFQTHPYCKSSLVHLTSWRNPHSGRCVLKQGHPMTMACCFGYYTTPSYIYTYYHKLFEHNSKTWFGWRYHLKDSQIDKTMNSAKTNAWFSWILALRQTEQKNITVSSGYPPGVTIIHDKPAGFSAPIDQWLICNQQCMWNIDP